MLTLNAAKFSQCLEVHVKADTCGYLVRLVHLFEHIDELIVEFLQEDLLGATVQLWLCRLKLPRQAHADCRRAKQVAKFVARCRRPLTASLMAVGAASSAGHRAIIGDLWLVK